MSRTRRPARSVRLIALSAAVFILAVLAALMPAAAFADSSTLYVGGAGCTDSGTGTSAQPFCTISKAAAVATAGQTVLVADGTYPEKVTVARSGLPGAPIVYQAAPGATVTVTGGANGFVVSGRQYVTISGFIVTRTSSYGIYVSGSSNIVISGNTVTYAGLPFSGQLAAGIVLSGTTASTVSANNTHHNSDSGIYLTSTTSSSTVSYNESSFNANQYQRNANGINVIGQYNTVIGNRLHDNEDSGLQFFSGGSNNLATSNVSYNNGDHGIDNLNVTGGRLIGNTVYHNCTSGINVEGTSGSYLVANNISVDNAVFLVNPTPNTGAANTCKRRAGNIGIWDSAPSSTTVNANLVYLTVPGTMYVFGSSYTSLAAMQAATGQEQQGLQADPRFVNPAGFDLRLQEGSPAIDSADSGASGEQPVDITGTARIDDPNVANSGIGPRSYDDRGGYEFASSVPGQLPPAAALAVSPSSGTAPLGVSFDASGSTDPQSQPLTYSFSFGDGTGTGLQASATATHTYASAGSFTATVTVTNTVNLSGTAQQTVTVSAPSGGGNPVYVSPIGTNYSTSVHTSGSITVWRTQGVAAGDLAVLTVALTGTSATGPVSATDDAGDVYAVAEDVADANGDRLVVLYGVVRTALVPNNRIVVTFPSATTNRITGDEASGVSALDQHASSAGTGSTYSSGTTATATSAREFVFGAVGVYAGTTPTWATEWTGLTTYTTGTNYLGRAYQLSSTTNAFAATGTTSGPWLAVCATFR